VTLSRSQVRNLLAEHGLAPSRALGQNFVADPNTVRRVVRLAGVGPGDHVVEIGPGLGSLTLALAETGAKVTAVEIDRHVLPVLHAVVGDRARIVEGDALHLDWSMVLGSDAKERWALVANLPYNVAVPLVLELLAKVPQIERMLVMVQLEVGERLAAKVGDPAYGIPSVKRAWWADAAVVGRVPPTVFVPQPRVDSALVRLDRRPEPHEASRERVFRLVEAGFGQRRKMLRRSLATEVAPVAFAAAGVRPEARAEELSLEDWLRLAAASPVPSTVERR
jgi:16S rRNA (adenine1518-N6/adenine1519-N6)-dimethyltransferase